jgi:hypothetical protein
MVKKELVAEKLNPFFYRPNPAVKTVITKPDNNKRKIGKGF